MKKDTIFHKMVRRLVKSSFAGMLSCEAMRGGWFHTGDAAAVHLDGYVEIRDRLKDVIISGGENISSVEVEGALLRHPAVQEVVIVGMPDERWGEAPHAFVILKAGA